VVIISPQEHPTRRMRTYIPFSHLDEQQRIRENLVKVVQPRKAATVMLLRASSDTAGQRLEVFMVRRVVQSEFMPDVYVFPGGSVSPDDQEAETTPGICRVDDAETAALSDPEGRTAPGNGVRAAAIRELFEEANVLLAYRYGHMLAIDQETLPRFTNYRRALNERTGSLLAIAREEQLVLATDSLRYFAHWITPEGMPKRYDTHFFLAQAPPEQEAAYDQVETSDGVWIQPAAALERFGQGSFPLTFPTFRQLRDLAVFNNVQQALDSARTCYVPTHVPILIQQEGKACVYLPEDPQHPWQL